VDAFGTHAAEVAELARAAASRGWALATSGNFSVVTRREPLQIAITASGHDKRRVTASEVVEVDAAGRRIGGRGEPSAETAIHLAVIAARAAGAVAHTHSPWSTLLTSDARTEVVIEGYEMLKALRGIATHVHRERLPIVENTQDWTAAAPQVGRLLDEQPDVHGFLIRRHGLYTWGADATEVKRHMEALEFLLEVIGRSEGQRGGAWRS
jgi:methylthioribulose-1-phosphate dehydratase